MSSFFFYKVSAAHRDLHSFPTRRSSDLDNVRIEGGERIRRIEVKDVDSTTDPGVVTVELAEPGDFSPYTLRLVKRSEEHTSELQSQSNLVCRLLLEKKNAPTTLFAM